jgi:hypothetical protein
MPGSTQFLLDTNILLAALIVPDTLPEEGRGRGRIVFGALDAKRIAGAPEKFDHGPFVPLFLLR